MGLLGKALIALGLGLVAVGIVLSFASRFSWFGNLPGDITVQRERFTFYFPITTSIIISIVLSLVLYFFRR